jgi:hypothetical protein
VQPTPIAREGRSYLVDAGTVYDFLATVSNSFNNFQTVILALFAKFVNFHQVIDFVEDAEPQIESCNLW